MANIGKYAIGIRLLLLKNFIETHAGVNRYVTRGEMEKYLEEKGYPVEKKTLYSDLAVLDSEFNMKLEYNPHKKGYRLLNPVFDIYEFKTIDERIEWNLDFAFSKAKCLDELMKQLAISRWCSLVKSKDESTGESVYAVVEKDMVVAQISFEDYLRTRREIANYAAYLFDNLLARQKRALLKPYPLEEGVEHYGINP